MKENTSILNKSSDTYTILVIQFSMSPSHMLVQYESLVWAKQLRFQDNVNGIYSDRYTWVYTQYSAESECL